jgi:Uma2 family endonuclease
MGSEEFMPIVSTKKMTARQFLQLGEDPPGVRLELVNGEIAVSASPLPQHSHVVVRLTSILDRYIEENNSGMLLSDCDTIFGEFDVRRPDILYFKRERQHLVQSNRAIDGPPDLCVEVLSKGTEDVDRVDKFEQYARGGIEYYWIVDPVALTIEAYHLSGGSYAPVGKGSRNDAVRLPPFVDLELSLSRLWFPKQKQNGSK